MMDDYDAFPGLRLSLALGGQDILSADCGALGQIERLRTF
jgi:hypothetical protein